MDQEWNNLAFLNLACQRSLRDRWRNSSKVHMVNGLVCALYSGVEQSGLDRWAIVLIKFSCISLLAKFEKRFHLFFHELPAAFLAQINLILIDDHDPHAFPLFPAGFADLGLDFGFKPPHEERVSDNFSRLSTRDTLDVRHDIRVLPHFLK